MESSLDSKKVRGYSVAIAIILIGILALVAATVISVMKSANITLWICEAIALACLIGALVAVIFAKRHIEKHEEKIKLNPYANVDKKEIDKVLDMISREEVRRKRSEDFAAGKDVSSYSDDTVSLISTASSDNPPAEEDELSFLVIDDHEDDIELPAAVPIILSDNESDDSTDQGNLTDTEKTDNKADNDREEEDDMNRGYSDYDDRAPRRRSAEGADRRERDPYYDEYYDERPRQRASRDMRDSRDPYASREREGVYYNEYGEPVRRRRPAYDPYYDDYYAERPRQRSSRDARDQRDMRSSRDPYAARDRGVYYNEYGEPVRRRPAASPYDDRRQGQTPRRRRPDGYPDGRSQMRYEDEDIRRSAPAAPVAPAASAAIDDSIDVIGVISPEASAAPKAPDYDESYVPVVIPDDDYDYDSARASHSGRAGVGSLHRQDPPRDEAPVHRSEPPRGDDRRYGSYAEDESIPVALPDDDYFENRYADNDRSAAYQRDSYRQSPPAAPAQDNTSRRARDRYVPDYEEEEMVVSLPRDDEYESYVEKKREEEELAEQQRLKEQRKAERKASGKIVLTIVKIRRRKIRRKSRKYKQFRASVHHLNEYLYSFSARGGRK